MFIMEQDLRFLKESRLSEDSLFLLLFNALYSQKQTLRDQKNLYL